MPNLRRSAGTVASGISLATSHVSLVAALAFGVQRMLLFVRRKLSSTYFAWSEVCWEEIPPLFGPSQQYQKHYANDAEGLERSFETKAHSEKSMNVGVKLTDEDDFLSRGMMIKANTKIICYLKEDHSGL